MHVSLRDASRRTGIPEEQLRRRILTGELAAQTVDDDRQYLVRLEDLGIASPAQAPVARSCSPFFFLKIAFALFLLLVTAAIVMPRMVPRHPGISCCAGQTTLAQELHRRGIVEAASRVDPEGAAELVRWALGKTRPVKGLWEKASFATKEEFRAWFDALRRYVPDRESR